ncbi:MAG: hypothetical protein P1U36_00960 [Legionellaceae bacterium]|nr:hypothetical protein [Legionellaceae bacterium]
MMFQIRHAMPKDLPQLLELEKVWPEAARATAQDLSRRIDAFAAGFFVVEDSSGIYASMICYPYSYDPSNLSNFKSWDHVNKQCFLEQAMPDDCNALYILSATNKKTNIAGDLSRSFMEHVFKLAINMNEKYVLAGILLPGYARYIKKYGQITPEAYVFKQINNRFVDPMIDKLTRLGFEVPQKDHVIADYFPDKNSLNYSALVVKSL